MLFFNTLHTVAWPQEGVIELGYRTEGKEGSSTAVATARSLFISGPSEDQESPAQRNFGLMHHQKPSNGVTLGSVCPLTHSAGG